MRLTSVAISILCTHPCSSTQRRGPASHSMVDPQPAPLTLVRSLAQVATLVACCSVEGLPAMAEALVGLDPHQDPPLELTLHHLTAHLVAAFFPQCAFTYAADIEAQSACKTQGCCVSITRVACTACADDSATLATLRP